MRKIIQTVFNKLGYKISKVDNYKYHGDFGLKNLITREKWLKQKLVELPHGTRILDAGAGELEYKRFCSHLNYVSQDFGKYDGIGDQTGLQMQSWDNTKLDIVSDITKIPEPDNSFDAIMCIEVFEHLPAPIEAIREFSRLLNKNGKLIITAPFCSLTHFAPYHFYSGFNRYFYEKHLTDSGFQIDEIIPNGNFFEYIAQELQCRIPNSYFSDELTGNEKRSVGHVIKMLERINDLDKNSSELLCFGYHIRAKKI